MPKIINKKFHISQGKFIAIVIGVPAALVLICAWFAWQISTPTSDPYEDIGRSYVLYYFMIFSTIVTITTSIWGIWYSFKVKLRKKYYFIVSILPMLLSLTFWIVPMVQQSIKEADPDYQRYLSSRICLYDVTKYLKGKESAYREAICSDLKLSQEEINGLNKFTDTKQE